MNCTISQANTKAFEEQSESSAALESATSDRKSMFSRSLISLMDQVIVSGTTFFTMYLVSGECSKAEVGAFALAATIVNFIRTVQERAIAAPYLAFAFKPGFDRNSFRGSSFVHQGVFATLVAIVAIGVVTFEWGMGFDRTSQSLAASLALTIPLLMVRDQIRAISAANFEFGRQLLLDIAIAFIQFSALLSMAWLNQFSIVKVYVVMGVACLIPSFFWLWLHRQVLEVDRLKIVSDWNHNWRYSRWLVGARVVGIFGYVIVPWMVAYFLDKSAAGAFAVCSSLVGVSLMFVTGLNNFFQPRTIREYHRSGVSGLRISMIESVVIVSGVLTMISIGLAFLGNELLDLLFGSDYATYGSIAFLLSLSTLSVSFSVLFGNGLAALGNSRQYFWGEFACCAVSVSSAAILIPVWGLGGAALSLILGGAASSLVTGGTLVRAMAACKVTGEDSLAMSECQS